MQQILQVGVGSAAGSGVFLSAPCRTGKSTFVREDLRPAFEAEGALVVYVDLWANPPADPGDAIVQAIRSALRVMAASGSNYAPFEAATMGRYRLAMPLACLPPDEVKADVPGVQQALIALQEKKLALRVARGARRVCGGGAKQRRPAARRRAVGRPRLGGEWRRAILVRTAPDAVARNRRSCRLRSLSSAVA